MDGAIASVIVAATGVVGTLLSPVLAQRSMARVARTTAEAEQLGRREEREENVRISAFQEKRQVYAELNSLARVARNAMKDSVRYYHKKGEVTEGDMSLVTSARLAYQECYDNAQMILPDHILPLASRLNGSLAKGFHLIKSLATQGTPTPEEIRDHCEGPILQMVTEMRTAMRKDLGVSS
ncbi:hypothetical protein ACH4TQ_44505 [Streptomyces sp. NPDC021218]|uniref:hypothetical protein n=1 Tax=Streptomyces sp. NPDC021218 TaxID=3365119 RepID=UPI0037B9D519